MDMKQLILEVLRKLPRQTDIEARFALLGLTKKLGLTDIRPQSCWEPEKKRFILRCLLETEDMAGDIVEFGVYQGGGTLFLAGILRDIGSSRCIHALDTFEGMPKPHETDIIPGAKGYCYEEKCFSDASCSSLKFVIHHYGLSGITLYKGLFSDNYHLIADKTFSLSIIDSDQYASTRECLEFVYARTAPGGLVLVDDVPLPGVAKAVEAFLADKPEILEPGALGMRYFRKSA